MRKELFEIENDFEDKLYLENKIALEGTEADNEDNDVDILENEVISYVGNFSLPEYASKLKDEIFKRPEFQRKSVWTPRQKSKLIESFLASYPVPPVILYKEKGKEQYLIIDGFQRVSTISEFFNDEFRLRIKNDKCRNKLYSKLPQEAREKLNNSFLNCTIVREISPEAKSKKFLYNLFERLNTGGKTLNAMETRRAISYGNLIKQLETLNNYDNWRKILGKTEIDNRFLDIELLLRLLVFYKKYDLKNYTLTGYTNMRLFLDEFVSENVDLSIESFSSLFKDVCDLIISELGNSPFHFKGTRPNYIILDSIMSGILILNNKVINLKQKFYNISKANSDYYNNKSGTLSKTRVEERLKFSIKGLSDNNVS